MRPAADFKDLTRMPVWKFSKMPPAKRARLLMIRERQIAAKRAEEHATRSFDANGGLTSRARFSDYRDIWAKLIGGESVHLTPHYHGTRGTSSPAILVMRARLWTGATVLDKRIKVMARTRQSGSIEMWMRDAHKFPDADPTRWAEGYGASHND